MYCACVVHLRISERVNERTRYELTRYELRIAKCKILIGSASDGLHTIRNMVRITDKGL